MLIALLIDHPAAALDIVRHTPPWVGLLLAGLVALGLSQWRERSASLARVTALAVAMTLLSLLGLVTAFAHSGLLTALGGWLIGFVAMWLLLRRLHAPVGARYEPNGAHFNLPGSPWPLLLILAIFLLKYAVGVELAMQPQVAHDLNFVLGVAGVYGVLSGVFATRAAALWRLARSH
jgi:FtsH-binding integral membrane protein